MSPDMFFFAFFGRTVPVESFKKATFDPHQFCSVKHAQSFRNIIQEA